jgi:chromosome segregation ATPase
METGPEKKDVDTGRIELQLAAWGAELDRLKAKVDRKIAEAQKEYYEKLEGLRGEIGGQVEKWGPEIRDLRARIEGELREWEPQIQALRTRADQAEDRAKQTIDQLKARTKEVKAKLKELRHASEGAWGDVKTGLGKAWEDLKPALQSAIGKFR